MTSGQSLAAIHTPRKADLDTLLYRGDAWLLAILEFLPWLGLLFMSSETWVSVLRNMLILQILYMPQI